MSAESGYVLGHDDPEIERLLLQGRIYASHTEQALRLAGLEPGMRVLDVGCGPGDVSLAAAHIVGPTGSVTAVDEQSSILDLAARRAAGHGASTIAFHRAEIANFTPAEPFDAVIGRLILMHLPDPVAALRKLAGLVRPGGVVTFQDFEISAARSVPELPLFTRVRDLIVQAFRGAGASTEMGTSLYKIFGGAGLPAPRLTMGACLGGVSDPELIEFVIGVWRTMLPVAERHGLELDDEVTDLGSLPARLRTEAAAQDAVIILPPLISAWNTTPED